MRLPARVASLIAALVASLLGVALGAFLSAPAPAEARPGGPRVGKCPVFPRSNHWNRRVDQLPVHERSDAIIGRIGTGHNLHPDFGSGLWRGAPLGMPHRVVGRRQPLVPIHFFAEPRFSDAGPYPIPHDAPIEPTVRNPDRHVVVVNKASCRLYEMYRAFPEDGGRRWSAAAGATWNLRSNRLRPEGWTSADAAGLPIFPGLVRHAEVRRGAIHHALRIAVPTARSGWIYPARHSAGRSTDPNLPAAGQRLRLKATVDPAGFPRQARVVVRALKRYGVLVADQGAPMHLTGSPSEGWKMDQVYSLMRLHARDFEVVDTSSLPRPAP